MYRVLLVDDEPAILQAEKRAIKKKTENFEVVGEAFSVSQAIEMVKSLKPDVILTDMKMPKQSGIELIRYVSEMEEQRIVCIAVSGYSDFEYVHDAFALGAYDYLLKPVEPNKLGELFTKINRLLVTSQKETCNRKLPPAKISAEELVDEIEAYIREHIAEDNSIIQICSRFTISQPYLSKIFKKYNGCTYNDFLVHLKIEEAKRMLEQKEGYLIGDIANLLGFSDQFYFSKVFKNATGCTPREYRKQRLEDANQGVDS